MMNIEKTIDALNKKFEESCYAMLTMKADGKKVNIEKYSDVSYCAYYSAIGECRLYTCDNALNNLAKDLCEYPKVLDEIRKENYDYFEDNVPKLQKFYEEHILGKEPSNPTLGYEFYKFGHDMWYELTNEQKGDATYVFDKRLLEIYLDEFVKEHPEFSREEVKEAFEYGEACETYSDWYKDVYGFRPRF